MNDSFTLAKVENMLRLFSLCGLFVLLGSVSMNAQLTVNASGSDPSCNGFTNGTILASATGGIPPYNYSWSNGETGPSVFGVGAGTYTVTVTDMMGTATGSVTLGQPSAMSTQAISTGTTCANAGGVDVNVSGGVGPYTYSWSNGSTSKTQSGLASGLYCVTVTDVNGCTDASCIGVVGALTVDVTTFDSRCAFACDGAANAIVTGGTGPYSYVWNTGGTTPTISPLGPGTYTVTVTDANGCMVIGTGVVSEPPPVLLTIDSQDPGCNNGNGGQITINSTGGVGPYTYLWNTGQTTNTINNLSTGTYIVNVTDANGCVKDTMVVLAGGSVNLIVNSSDVTCGGSDDGTATAFASNGVAPYSYTWSNGMSGTFIGNLSPGDYTVTATDATGCASISTVTVGAGGTGLNLNFTSTDESCGGGNDGTAGVTAAGGSGNYTYNWSNGMSTGNISGLGAGSYSVTVNDGTGCFSTGSVVINAGANISANATTTDASCGSLGTASVNPSGGSAPYSFAWSNGSTAQNQTGLAAGNYSVTVTDANGCTSIDNNVGVADGGSALTLTFATSDEACADANNGTATVAVGGGSGNYTYAWSNGMTTADISGLAPGTYNVTVNDGSGCSGTGSASIGSGGTISLSGSATDIPCGASNSGTATVTPNGGTAPYTYAWSNGGTTQNISNLGVGSYGVTVTDVLGCTSSTTVNVSEESAPVMNVTSTNALCLGTDNGSATANVTSGGPVTYSWSNGATTSSISNLGAGTYSVTATNADGCTATGSTTITAPSSAVSGTATITGQISVAGANDGSATANGSGGTPGYTYSWSNGATTQSISNLGPGTYTVTITDSNGCTTTASVTLSQGPPPCNQDTNAGVVSSDQTFCGPGFDPTTLVGTAPTGGSGALTYLWMYSTTASEFGNGGSYTGITGATGISYDPGPVYQTTYFVRCSWRAGCPTPIETNVVKITVDNPNLAEIIGGPTFCPGESISFSTPDLGAGTTYSWDFDSAPLSNTATPGTSGSRSASTTYTGNNPNPIVKLTVNTPTCSGAMQVLRLSLENDCPPAIIFKSAVNGTKEVKLDWSSLLPDGDYKFEIQRSANGIDFSTIAEMNAMGDSNNMSYFSFMDSNPKRGEAHYRINVLRLNDGMTATSSVEKVQVIWGSENVFVYPNPTQNDFVVERFDTFNAAGSIEIINSRGQVVLRDFMDKDATRKELNLENLTAGVYMLRVTYKNGVEAEVQKFIKR